MQMPSRTTRISAAAGVVLALAAGLGLALWPCAYRGIEVQSGVGTNVERREVCVSLVEQDGADVLGLLAVPVVLSGASLVAVRGGWRVIFWVLTLAVLGFCVFSLASVGLFYLPAAGALLLAGIAWGERPQADA
jgi:thiol:disulfide interchange protein